MNTLLRTSIPSSARTIGLIPFVFCPLLSPLNPPAHAETVEGPETRFSPDQGQPLFPAGNLNILKQFIVDWDVSERVGKTTEIDLLFDSITFGGELSAGVESAFGIEVGLCFGGNADFDIGFRPTVTLPDRYPSEVLIPLTVSEGLLPDSSFSTAFPPLGKAYADLVFNLGAQLKARACVFGCVNAVDFNLSTCALPPLQPSGVKLFKESVRCDPALFGDTYCSIELASFNREDDNTLRMLNVGADDLAEFLLEPYIEFEPSLGSDKPFTADPVTDRLEVTTLFPLTDRALVEVCSSGTLPGGLSLSRVYYVVNAGGTDLQLSDRAGGPAIDLTDTGTGTHTVSLSEVEELEEPLEGKYGTLSIAVPTVATDSSASPFNTAEVLKSSGAEDIMGIGIDVAAMASDFMIPPLLPPLSDSGGSGPVSWDYTLASLALGPAVQLQTDFEMTWDLEVTEVTFTEPETLNPRAVKINGQTVSRLTDVTPSQTYHLTNRGVHALPDVELITTDPPLPVEVTVIYELKPKLRTVVSTPFIGQLNYQALAASASISRVGNLGFGPLVQGAHKFKFGEFKVFDGDPSPIESGAGIAGTITFQLLAAGPPSFKWNPAQLGVQSNNEWSQVVGNSTNWLETLSDPPTTNSYPGMGMNMESDVVIDASPFPSLYSSVEIATLQVGGAGQFNIMQRSGESAPVIIIGGGLIENVGTVNVTGDPDGSSIKFDSPDSVLCGTGTVLLSNGGSIKGYAGPEPFTFCSYNTVRGTGEAMDQYFFSTSSAINNVGTFRAEGGGNQLLITSANKILNQGVFESLVDTDYSLYGDRFESRVGSLVAAEGSGSRVFLSFDDTEHAGLIRAGNGGYINIAPWNLASAMWHAGQSLTNDVGFFRAEDAGSELELQDLEFTGGCFFIGGGGALAAFDTNFAGTVFHIGDFNESQVDAASGTFTLNGANQIFNRVCFTNFGTVRIPGQVEFFDNIIFANNGTVVVPEGGRLQIYEKLIQTAAPGAPSSARSQPGSANATAEILMGGTWDISGTVLIEGAAFTRTGANAARASTRSASIDDLGGETGDSENDLSRVLSLGNPAEVILRGANWCFPALDSLAENGGNLHLVEGANFPGGSGGNSTVGSFTNSGGLLIEAFSQMTVGGAFIQTGTRAETELTGGALVSASNHFEILGGTVTASAGSEIFNLSGNTIPSGTTIRVESPLIDTNMTDSSGAPVFEQEPVCVEVDAQITAITQASSVTIHGAAVDFSALTGYLTTNSGAFTVSGDGVDNAPRLSLGFDSFHTLTNTGDVNVLGYTTDLQMGTYIQNATLSSTRIGAGAKLTLFDSLAIEEGEIVVEIGAPPRQGLFGQIVTSYAEFGNGLVIDFTGEFAAASASVDVGDTWEIIPRTSANAANVTGVDTVTYRLDGAPLPGDWLPAGSHLEVVRFPKRISVFGAWVSGWSPIPGLWIISPGPRLAVCRLPVSSPTHFGTPITTGSITRWNSSSDPMTWTERYPGDRSSTS